MIKKFTYILASLFVVSTFANEAKFLSNIRQVTFPSMGFSKAGEGYFSPDERLIIFQAVPDGKKHYQMYVMDLEEGIPKMVSTGVGACTCGNFHPFGGKIIFASSHSSPLLTEESSLAGGKYRWDLTPYMNIYEADIDGKQLKPLTRGSAYHAECAYSPDGREIVFASNEDGSMNLYIMDAGGGNIKPVTKTTDSYNGGCFFSPDGNRIVFRSDRDKRHFLQLYVIDVDGKNEKQLTANNAVNWAPYWYPDGVHIAFTKSVDHHRCYEIFLLNTLTGEERQLTYGSSFDGLPVFNHDGTKLLWTSKRGADGSCQLFLADFTRQRDWQNE